MLARRFRTTNYVAMLDEVRRELPDLRADSGARRRLG